jgi:hypothetical protein
VAGPVGSTVGVLTGVAVGGAATVALQPAFEIPRQDAWSRNANKVLDADTLARLVAQGAIDLSSAAAEAKRNGYGPDKLDALVYLEQAVPGVSEALHLWRLGFISDALFTHTLVKAGLDARYIDPLVKTKTEELIGLGDIAYAVVRGILPAPSYVPVAPPAHGDKVPRFPQVPIDPEVLAAKIGYSPQALEVMVGRSGLSMAPGMAAQAFFRNIIGPNDFLMAIAEGDLRTEWSDAVREVSRQILTAGEYAELELRGFYDAPTRRAKTAQHGMSTSDSDDLFNVLGRAPGVHGITTGLARGANFPGNYSSVPEPYKSAIQRSNIRPEYAEIEYHNRYSYPSGFQIRAETQNGTLSQADADQILLEVGWAPKWATLFSQAWSGGTATGGDKHTAKAQTQLWSTTHKSYVAQEIDEPTAAGALAAAGVPAAAVPGIINVWNHERNLIRKQLTPAQIKKAFTTGTINPATGQPWTQRDAELALIARGYDQNDATVLLTE